MIASQVSFLSNRGITDSCLTVLVINFLTAPPVPLLQLISTLLILLGLISQIHLSSLIRLIIMQAFSVNFLFTYIDADCHPFSHSQVSCFILLAFLCVFLLTLHLTITIPFASSFFFLILKTITLVS